MRVFRKKTLGRYKKFPGKPLLPGCSFFLLVQSFRKTSHRGGWQFLGSQLAEQLRCWVQRGEALILGYSGSGEMLLNRGITGMGAGQVLPQ